MSVPIKFRQITLQRRGFATVLVLLVIAALSLVVYTFATQSFLEHSATRSTLRQTQLRLTAASAVDALRSQLKDATRQQRHEILNNISNRNVLELGMLPPEYQFGLYRQVSRKSLTPGLSSESAKLNIHSLDLSRSGEVESRSRLMSLPNMTPYMADSLLDWLDADDEPRTFGAELAWYADHSPATRPANGPIQHLYQLTYIRGFNESLVFGEDTNNNGWLDWNEDDGDAQLPSDNHDGKLDRGLSQYLSVDAFESNLDSNGNRKIYLNNADLSEMFLQLENRFGERVASFIATYRLDGPVLSENSSNAKSLREELDRTFDSRLEKQLDDVGEGAEVRKPTRQIVKRKGTVALDRTPLFRIDSVIDLIGVSVITIIDGEEKLLNSPWEFGGSDSHELLLKLEAALTTVDGDRLIGRIDFNQAPLAVLLTIPGLTRAQAEAAVAVRERMLEGAANDSFRSIYWLVENQVLSVEELRQISSLATVNGAIYSGYAAGHDRSSRSSAFIKFTLCQEGSTVRLLDQSEVGFAPLMEQDVLNDRSKIR